MKSIDKDVIHLWVIRLDDTTRSLDDYLSTLSDQEVERVDDFVHRDLQRRYIIAHARMREILSVYIGIEPRNIDFTTNAYNKPFLVTYPERPNIHFNLSHSGNLAILGIAKARRIGVDVERLKPIEKHMQIARRYFSPGEISALKRLKEEQRSQKFIQLWAGKEAFIKAQGEGMSLPLNQFSLEGLVEQTGETGCMVKLPGAITSWFVYPIKLITGYRGAIAIEGKVIDIKYLNR